MENERYLGKSSLYGKPARHFRFLLGDKAVKTHHIDNGAVTGEKIADGTITTSKFASDIQSRLVDMVNQALQESDFPVEEKTVVELATDTNSNCSIEGANNSGKTETIVYTNPTATDLLVMVPATYHTPNGQSLDVLCPSGGYCEVSYMNINGIIYARGI